jgi:hypothetical protein
MFCRDCVDNQQQLARCVAGAVSNFTQQASGIQKQLITGRTFQHDTFETAVEALMFLVHFAGDLHQPLHVAHANDRGGHYPVSFFGEKMSLHAVWDFGLIQKAMKEQFGGSQDALAASLSAQINDGGFADVGQKGWLDCVVTQQAKNEASVTVNKATVALGNRGVVSGGGGGGGAAVAEAAVAPLPAACPAPWAQESIVDACRYAYAGADEVGSASFFCFFYRNLYFFIQCECSFLLFVTFICVLFCLIFL